MSSSVLNKRIIVNLTADTSQQSELNNEELDDSLPPVKKPFVASFTNSLNEETSGDDESIPAASLPISVGNCAVAETAETIGTQNEIREDSAKKINRSKASKLWMKVGGVKREPRVGSDFQAMIE